MKRRSTYQQKIIQNYYEHRDDIMLQTLSEIVSELYLATNDTRRRQLWRRAESCLQKMGIEAAETTRIVRAHDLAALAKIISREF